ncbi:hypothetical protein E4U60_006539 [Claviceps pazoutovae]|uniref:Deacetylase sirtuin-type domain-containing protein n=1 Tax=Claviceps pazoutovae TaxID=1649127 RepID=A0A9P7SI12_9HYPO|nr:hypothetical protein E4U60_006539 [Claviceps pazoutovae]
MDPTSTPQQTMECRSTSRANPSRRKAESGASSDSDGDASAAAGKAVVVDVPSEAEDGEADASESWETESLYEDVLEELLKETINVDETAAASSSSSSSSSLSSSTSASASASASSSSSLSSPSSSSSPDMCTPLEATQLRRELRDQGPAVFCQRTVDCGRYTAKKLLTAFGIKPPAFLEGEPDEAYFDLLSLAISRELSKREKLSAYNTVDDAVRLLTQCSNIIVITGAGISTSLGIPDFRSKGTGLYSKLEHLGLGDPQEVFDINVFRQDPSIFYSIAKDIIPATDRYTPTHKFIAMLHQRGKLLTNYSQNIDNLEVKAGLPKSKLIQCHGSFGTATCVQCRYQTNGEAIFPEIKAGHIPRCPRCIQSLDSLHDSNKKRKRSSTGAGPSKSNSNRKRSRRRGHHPSSQAQRWCDDTSDSDDDLPEPPTAGVMKPDITFFGEALPDEFSERLTKHDRDKVDLVIVIGTSLKVSPVSEIVSFVPQHVPQIYVSREPVTHVEFDIDLLGDCDVVVAELCRRLGWPMVHDMLPAAGEQSVRVSAGEGCVSRHVFEAVETAVAAATTAAAEAEAEAEAECVAAPTSASASGEDEGGSA